MPGYQIAAVSSTLSTAVTACPAGEYCPGVANLFAGAAVANSGVTATTYTTSLILVSNTALASGSAFVLGSSGPALGVPCPTGTTNAGANTQVAISSCTDLAAGYAFTPSQTATNTPTIRACVKGNYGCAGTTGLFQASPTASTGVTYVAAGSAISSASTASGVTTLTLASSGTIATAATGDRILASCPSGVTNAVTTGNTIASCSDLAVGWAFNPSISPASTNLTVLLTQCAAGSYGCKGVANVFVSSITTSTVNSVASSFGTTGLVVATTSSTVLTSATAITTGFVTGAANAGANIKGTCPAYATNTFTATSTPTWAATAAAAIQDCTDLVPGYGFAPSASSATTVSTLLESCLPGYYGSVCAGSPGLFTSAPVAAVTNTSLTGTVTYQSGLASTYAAGDLVLASPTDFAGAFGTLGAPGALLISECPSGSTNAGGAAMTSISSCIVQPGYYVDHSNLNCVVPNAPSSCPVCPAGEYCTGGGAVGTAGGDTVCPTGSVGPESPSALNSNIADCVLSAGYYTTSAAPNVPAACPSGFFCAGGAALGTAGGVGSTSCTGSSNPACLAPAGPAKTTINGAPVTVSPAAVTVSPAAVTVTPAAQPITINFTHSPVFASAAPRAAAHAAVLALAALAALVAF
jgi:hypothetical protein